MKAVIQLSFYVSDVPDGEATILGPAHCGPDVAVVEEFPWGRHAEVTLEVTDDRLPILRRLLKQDDLRWVELHGDTYTEDELDGARLLLMVPNGECEIYGGVHRPMTYDPAGACPGCGSGARQTSVMFVDGERLSELEGHRAGATPFGHLLVDEGIAAELRSIGASGLFFRSVYAVMPDRRRVALPWKQLCTKRTLPPMSRRTTGFVRKGCKVCRRSRHFDVFKRSTRIVYRAADLRGAGDVNRSWEHREFWIMAPEGPDRPSAYPLTLVTPKVWRVFRDASVTSFHWLPIRVEGADE